MDLVIGICTYFSIFFCIIILHEILHIFTFIALKFKCYVKLVKWHHIPMAIGLFCKDFDKPFMQMDKQKQSQYMLIAITPYLLIFPICIVLMQSDNMWLILIGIVTFISHLINLPLEFYFVKEG